MRGHASKGATAGSRARVDTSPAVSDEVKYSTCYMCACRCGIKVHLKDGAIRYIQGNRNHPVNKGVLCAKGSAGIMQHYSPARLTKPLKRVGERGAAEFEEIEWDAGGSARSARATRASWPSSPGATRARR
jgi:anaerobic selenocysteine-containing dehydrogenase